MRRLLVLLWIGMLAAVPAVQAGTSQTPELVDPAGDQQVAAAPGGLLWGQGADLLSVWFTDNQDGLTAHIHAADLASVEEEMAVPQTDTMFIARFRLDHAEKTGAAGRDGDWTLRADAHPGGWSYWAEGPCLDGRDEDGCAGEDRDIIDEVPGTVDLPSSVVSITLPRSHLGPTVAGDGIVGLYATIQQVYPAWPAYTADWDNDQVESSDYRYQWPPAPPTEESGAEPSDGASPAPSNPHGTTTSAVPAAAGRPDSARDASKAAPPHGPKVEGPAGSRETPVPLLAGLAALGLAVVVRRQSR